MDEALKLFTLPRKLGQLDGKELTRGDRPLRPFVKRGDTYASLDKTDDPYEIDYERGAALIRAREELIANRLIKGFDESPCRCSTASTARTSPTARRTARSRRSATRRR
jgi:DNA topoisomerase-1